jgi:hypothetical protein
LAGERQKRKARKRRRAASAPPAAAGSGPAGGANDPAADAMARGYARGRRKDEEARAALVPLEPGERPLAVTVGAVVAALLALAEVIAFVVSFDPDESSRAVRSAVVVPLLLLMAWGMWKAKYWAVLGMEALLALTIISSAVALTGANNVWAVLLVLLIVVGGGALFWFLIRAMARIQMPERPGSARR